VIKKNIGGAAIDMLIKMRKKLQRVIEIPAGVDVSIKNDEFTVKGNGKESNRKFNMKGINAKSQVEK
jgi:ribosomal protein L6P/L9E